MKGVIRSVTISDGKPEVTFMLTDLNDNAIVGLENFNSATAPVNASGTCPAGVAVIPTQRTVSATIAKLVPGVNGGPSKWVNYISATIDPTKADTPWCKLQTPGLDAYGTLTYTGNGVYKYKFRQDIAKVKAYVDASTDPYKGDVGDLTYDPNLPWRVVVQIGGAARGTGTNTPDGIQLVAAVNLENTLNLVWNANNPNRDIVETESCNACHVRLEPHGLTRWSTDFCVVCHTNQRKYAQTSAKLTTTTYKYDDGSTQVFPSWDKEPRKFPPNPQNYTEAMRDMPIMIHAIHAGELLPVRAMPVDPATGQNSSSDYIDEVAFPQPLASCTNCHNGDSKAVNYTPQGNNYKTVPTRMACGACHNNVDFATGLNHPAPGGIQADDSKCASCHTASAIESVYHVTVDPTGSEGRGGYPVNTADNVPTPGYPAGQGPAVPLASHKNPPAGVPKFDFEIASVSVASNKATIKYRILMDGVAVKFQDTGYLLPGIDGSPSLYVSYGQLKDGVAQVVDWTASINTTVLNCRNQVATACTQTGPDATGFYTATLAGTVPSDAKIVTAMLGINYQGFIKLDNPSYPKGIRIREPNFAIKAASTSNMRRDIIDNERCNSCHSQLGVEPSFHSGARNNGSGCATGGCHWQSYSTGHTGANYNYGGGWSLSGKNMIHAIHGASIRTQYFNYEATAKNQKGFGVIGYPGILNNCLQCHKPGTFDWSNTGALGTATGNAAAVPYLLWTTDADKDMSNPNNVPTIGLSPWVTTLGRGQVDYRSNPLVSSPIASTCFACHDSMTSVTHMQQNGGILLGSLSTITGVAPASPPDRTGLAKANKETCLVCHGPGTVAAIAVVHGVK